MAKTIEQKLKEHVLDALSQFGGIGGHAFCVYKEEDEIVKECYEFGDVKFKIRNVNDYNGEIFYCFDCDIYGDKIIFINKYGSK